MNRTVDDTKSRLERARPRSVWIDTTFRAVEHDTSAGGAVIAGAVAFRVFLYIVPFVFVLVVGLGVAADAASEDPGDLARSAGIGGLVAKAVGGAADLSGFERASALVIGVWALFAGARALLKVLRLAYGMVWNVRPSKLKKTTKPALGLILLTIVALALVALLDNLRGHGPILSIIGFALFLFVPVGLWMVAMWYLPRRTQDWIELLPGAIFFALGVLALHLITVLWIAHVLETKTDTYGAIGAALAILLWAYLLGRLVTGAAVINATLWLRRHRPPVDTAAPASTSRTRPPTTPDTGTGTGTGPEPRRSTNNRRNGEGTS